MAIRGTLYIKEDSLDDLPPTSPKLKAIASERNIPPESLLAKAIVYKLDMPPIQDLPQVLDRDGIWFSAAYENEAEYNAKIAWCTSIGLSIGDDDLFDVRVIPDVEKLPTVDGTAAIH